MPEPTTAQFNTEGQPTFPVANTENDNSADSPSVEETNTDQTPSSEENKNKTEEENGSENTEVKPLHEEPRWKEREDDWKERYNDQEKRHSDEIQKLREDFDGKITQSTDHTPSHIPSWFGGDENDWKEFQEYNKTLINEAQEKVQTNIDIKGKAEQKAIDDATTYMNDSIVLIETDRTLNPDGSNIDRNKLLKFVMDNELVDTKGRWNYKAGWNMMKAGIKASNDSVLNEKKKIAVATTSENRAETEKPNYTTSEHFSKQGNRPW